MTLPSEHTCECIDSLNTGDSVGVEVIDGGVTDRFTWSAVKCENGHTNIFTSTEC